MKIKGLSDFFHAPLRLGEKNIGLELEAMDENAGPV